MPSKWSDKDERMYDEIKESSKESGKSEKAAKRIAAATVNKKRRKEGRTPNKTSQGTGNPRKQLEQRSVTELRNLARRKHIQGRSHMRKEQLIEALRKAG